MDNRKFVLANLACLGTALIVSACGPEWPDETTDSAGQTSNGTDSASSTGAEDPTDGGLPPIERMACGPSVEEGWVTRCWNDSSFLRIGKDGDEENAETIPDVVGFSHYWWVPGTLVTTGSTVDVVLPNGSHMIALVTKDSDGHLDATAITYARTCR